MNNYKINLQDKMTMREPFFWLIGMTLFLLPLFNAWMLYPLGIENSETLYSALGGILPWSDAQAYYSGANALLEYGDLDAWSTRRPLNAILFSVRLWLANNNFQIALMIEALLCGVSCLLVTKSIARSFGKVSGIATLFILFVFSAVFIPTTLSEKLGLTLGCLAFVFLWEGIQSKSTWLFFWAGLILMLGLNARAGAFFTLPLIILWLGFYFKNNPSKKYTFNWRLPTAFVSGLIIASLFNLIILKLYNASNNGAMHGNFSYTLFGLVSGGNLWTHAYTVYPEILTKTEAETSHFLYLKSYEAFKENPFLLLLGIMKNLASLLKAFSKFFQYQLPKSLSLRLLIYPLGILLLCLGVGRLKKLYKINQNEIGLIIIMLVGMTLSAGIIWRDGGFRLFAVTIPFFAAAFGIVLGSYRLSDFQLQNIHLKNNPPYWETTVAYILSSLLLILGIFGPLLLKNSHSLPDISNFSCASGETAIITKNIVGAPHVNIAQNPSQFRNVILRGNTEYKDAFLKILALDTLKEPLALALVYDLNTKGTKYIVAPVDLFSNHHKIIGICTTPLPETNSIISQTKSFGVLSEK